jgi:hypothetical protein
MIRGVTVTLLEFSRTGVGLSWDPVEVGNVLIAPVSEVDSTTAALPEGHRAIYHLAIPKADTHRWEGQLVQFWDCTWAVVGIPTEGMDELIPGPWNKKVTVEHYRTDAPDVDSLWRDQVLLKRRIVARDASGYPGTDTDTGRTVNAILPMGVILEKSGEDAKQALRAKLNAEIWEDDFTGEDLLEYGGTGFEIAKLKKTGRGTFLLECEEVWR